MKLEDHMEAVLDDALEATFPASDPVAIAIAAERWRTERQERARSRDAIDET